MNFESFDDKSDDLVAPDLTSIMDIVRRRQRRRYQAVTVGAVAGLAAAGAVVANTFQRDGTVVENFEAAGESGLNNSTVGDPTDPDDGEVQDEGSAESTQATPAEETTQPVDESPTTTSQVAATNPDDGGDEEGNGAAGNNSESPTTAEAVTTAPTITTSTTAAPAETTQVDQETTTTQADAVLCPSPSEAMDNGAWVGRGLADFSDTAISQEDVQTLADSWKIPTTETQALLGLASGSGVNLMNDLAAVEIWDNWVADFQSGETLVGIAEDWNSSTISVKALYLIGYPAAVEAVSTCPRA